MSHLDCSVKEFLDKELSSICDAIDYDPKDNLPKLSETFVGKVLKDPKGDLVENEAVHKIMHEFRRKCHRNNIRKLLILGGFGLGKCLISLTKVIMYDGTLKKVDDIQVNDLLMGPDSKPRKVLFLGGGEEESYRITLSNKDFFECNKSHILSLKVMKNFWDYEKGEILNINIIDYLEIPEWIKKRLKLYKVPIEFEYKKVSVDPYKYGTMIGNFRKKHGFTNIQFHNLWMKMKERCDNPNLKSYKYYGERGITYDPKWEKFEGFYEDMYFKYLYAIKQLKVKHPSLERKDVNGNYCFDNCCFIEFKDQGKNTRKNKWFKAISPEGIEYISKNQTEFAKQHKLNQTIFYKYLNGKNNNRKGWKFEYIKEEIQNKKTFLIEEKENDFDGIDSSYLINSKEVRLQVLAGCLDIHGSINNGGESYRIVTKSIKFRDDFLYLCRSLGFSVSFNEEKYGDIIFYRITVSGNVYQIPCKIKKLTKRENRKKSKRCSLEYSFKVEPIGVKKYFGFGLDKDHLFLLHDFTVTHNTEQICVGLCLYEIAKNPNILIKIVHISESEANNRVRAIKEYIENDEDFKNLCPHIQPTAVWGQQRFIVKRKTISKDPTCQGFAAISGALGGRAHLIIFDDCNDYKSAVLEPSTRESVEGMFKTTWNTRLMQPESESEAIVLMNRWHESLYKSSELLTKSGLKNIDQLKITDEVFTSNGIFEKVLKTHKGLYKGTLYKIIPHYFTCFDFECTHDHEVLLRDDYCQAHEINEDDYLVIPIPKFKGNWKEKCLEHFIEKRIHKSKLSKNVEKFVSKEELEELINNKVSYKKISETYGVSVDKVFNLVQQYGIDTKRFNNIDEYIFDDLDFWRILGYWMAEGSFTEGRKNDPRDVIRFSFGAHEKNHIENVKQFFNKYNIHVGEHYTNRNSCNLKISCKQLAYWIKQNFDEYEYNKRLPDWFYGLPEEQFFEFLIGYSDGDGYVNNRDQIIITSVSKTLLFQIQQNLLRFGIISQFNKNSSGGIKKVDFGWGEHEIVQRQSYSLKITNDLKEQKFAYIEGDFLYTKIKEIKTRSYFGYVHDITTPSHDFISPFVVHNSDLANYIQNNPIWAWCSIEVAEDKESLIYKDSFGLVKQLPLWTKYPKISYINKHIEMGDRDYNRGYRLIPYSDSDKTFPSFNKCCRYGIKPIDLLGDMKDWLFVGGIDFAGDKRPGTILQIVASHRVTGARVPVEWYAENKSTDLVKRIFDTWQRFGVELYMAENNATQGAIIDLMETQFGSDKFARFGIKIEGFTTGKNKGDILNGLPSLEKEMEKQEWTFCFDRKFTPIDNDDRDLQYRYYMEHLHHPFYKTSDFCMSGWFCREAIKKLMQKSKGNYIY